MSPDAGPVAALSPTADAVAAWIGETADNQGLPFLIVDKVHAEVVVFDRDGRRLGTSAALLGLARGDVSPPGIGDRPLSAIGPEDRVTPAGRFLASIGENLDGKSVLWIDYDDALSLHPVVPGRPVDRRAERLTSTTADDNRISYGCINVPAAFYAQTVHPAFAGSMGVVYILPEVRTAAEIFFVEADAAAPE